MEPKIEILIYGHDIHDVGLLQQELEKSKRSFTAKAVLTKEAFAKVLYSTKPDIILADCAAPLVDGLAAFRILQRVAPEIPFIILSDGIGEENAVELIKFGVQDLVRKDNMGQCVPKILRALKEAGERNQQLMLASQLRQRDKQFQKVLDLSLDVICTVDEQGRFVTIGAASKSAWGYSPAELIGRMATDLVHKSDKNKSCQALTNLTCRIDIVNFENRYICKNGSCITLVWSARWDPQEQLGYCVARDITEIKQARQKIKSIKKRFRTLLQNSTDGICLITADGTVIERSPGALKILELNEEQEPGELRIDLVHPHDLTIVEQTFKQVVKKPNEIRTITYRFRMPGGSYKWVESIFHNQLHEPAVGAIVANFRDITESINARIALSKSEEKYRHLFDFSPSPMWVFDEHALRFLDMNEAAVKFYGYSKEEFLGLTLQDIRPNKGVEGLEEAVNSMKDTDQNSHFITKHVRKGGEVIDVDIKVNLVEVEGRKARLVIATDIGERMRYIQAIKAQNENLREIAWVQSHVVRAPLARMMGLINLLEKDMHQDISPVELLQLITDSAHELDDYIRDIVQKAEEVISLPIIEEKVEQDQGNYLN